MKGSYEKSLAYQRQAQADLTLAAMLVDESGNLFSKCHVLAMCQQAVEKSVKALYILNNGVPARSHQVDKLVSLLLERPKYFAYAVEIYGQLSRLFRPTMRRFIEDLSKLAPLGIEADPNETHRNTEYPFMRDQAWIAPCDIEAFSDSEIKDMLHNTRQLLAGIQRIRLAVERVKLGGS